MDLKLANSACQVLIDHGRVQMELRRMSGYFVLTVDGQEVDRAPAWPPYLITPPESVPFMNHVDALRAWLDSD